jgi:hypothetical protein
MSVEIDDINKTPVRKHTRWLFGILVNVESSFRRRKYKFSKFLPSPGQMIMNFPISYVGLKSRTKKLKKPSKKRDQFDFDF